MGVRDIRKFKTSILAYHPPDWGGSCGEEAYVHVNSTLYKTSHIYKSSFTFVFIIIFIFDGGGGGSI